MAKSIQTVTCFNTNDKALHHIGLAYGELVHFSRRAPGKNTANEDSLGLIPVADDTIVLVVADGMGGLTNGDKASKTVVECLIAALADHNLKLREAILNAIDMANEQILNMQTNAGTTAVIVELHHNTLRIYYIGDSLVLLTTAQGEVKYQTIPHSPVAYAQASGVLTEKMAMCHPNRNLLSNYIGDINMHIDISPIIELERGDTLIIASDGLSDALYQKEICNFISTKSMAAGINELITQCKNNMITQRSDRSCHPDDLSLISFRKKI